MGILGAVGSTLSAGASAVGGLAKGIGSMMSSDDEEKKEGGNTTVIANMGMAGSAAQQKVTGKGTIPAAKPVAKPNVSDKAPTTKLLNIAVNYLASIDNTLKSQINFDKKSYDEQVMAARESKIEENKNFSFGDLKDRFSGMGQKAKDTGSFLGKAVLGILAGAAVLGNILDEEQLKTLNKNLEDFGTHIFSILKTLAFIGIPGYLGLRFGGVKGALIGATAGYMYGRTTGSLEEGLGQQFGATGYGIQAGVGALALANVFKQKGKIAKAGEKILEVRTRPHLSQMTGAARRGAIAAADAGKAKAWFSSRRGRKFLAILGRKVGKTVMRKMEKYLIRIGILLAASATGVLTIPSIVGLIVSIGFIAWDLWDIGKQIYDSYNESEKEESGADAVTEADQKKADATPVAGSTPSTGIKVKSETGTPEKAQAFFESKGWTKEQAAGIVGNLWVESGLKTDAVGDGGKAYGIAQWHPDRQAKFQQVYGKDIRSSTLDEQLEFVNWELNNSEKRAGDLIRGASSADEAAALVDEYYERSSGAARQARINNANAIMGGDYKNLQGGGGSGSGGAGGITGMIGGGIEKSLEMFGGLVGKAMGPQSYSLRSINTPLPDFSKKIDQDTSKIQNAMAFGIDKKKQKDNMTSPSNDSMNKLLSSSSPNKTVGTIDPNYQGKEGIKAFLAHYKLVA